MHYDNWVDGVNNTNNYGNDQRWCCSMLSICRQSQQKNDRKKTKLTENRKKACLHFVSLVLATNLIDFLYSTDIADSKEATLSMIYHCEL